MLTANSIDFSMCNPPFYESKADMLSSAASKQRPPFTACTGSEIEMVTPGGEIAFVSRMIADSLILQDRVQWYTSMLGKFSSLAVLIQKLKDHGIGNYAVTEFVQGNKTRRWGIAWSHDDLRPSMNVARGVSSLPKAALPFPSEYAITVSTARISQSEYTKFGQFKGILAPNLASNLNDTLSQLPMQWIWKAQILTGVGFTEKDVWSRSARRLAASTRRMDTDDDPEMTLGFKIHLRNEDGNTKLIIRWLKGQDSVLFESFCGMVKRKLEEVTK
jgi:23S rRNA (adenine1618-N6)-methyltransferase